MNIQIESIANPGDLQNERLVLKAMKDVDIGDFILLHTGRRDDSPTTWVKNTYWFPNKAVKAGDLIVIYSKLGTQSEKELASGSKAHFFYWGQRYALWMGAESAGVVVNAAEWKSFIPEHIYSKKSS